MGLFRPNSEAMFDYRIRKGRIYSIWDGYTPLGTELPHLGRNHPIGIRDGNIPPDRQTDRQTDGQTDGQTERRIKGHWLF
jgi:hypothetical protein